MPAPPAIGSVRFHDKVIPDLGAGDYRVSSTLEIAEGGQNLAPPGEKHTHIRILAPRFALAPDEVSECFPPPAGAGPFGLTLPHVTLGRRTLPWERRIAGNDAPGRYPWMALLVVSADEAQLVTGTLRALLPAEVVTRLEAREAIAGDPAVTVLALRDAATLRALLPTRDEAGLLAHVRQVNLADTALAGRDDDGWFATVTANRLPQGSAAETPYLACLVSLEERSDVFGLRGNGAPPPLVVLHSWPFTVSGAAGTFGALAAALDVAPFGGGAQEAGLIDDLGRVPVSYSDHEGLATGALYRGPLLGLSDAAAPADDTADISLAAAYELGRLLGIADGRLLRDLVEWHRSAEAEIRAGLEQQQLQLPTAVLGMITGSFNLAAVQEVVALQLDTGHLRTADIGRLTLTEIVP